MQRAARLLSGFHEGKVLLDAEEPGNIKRTRNTSPQELLIIEPNTTSSGKRSNNKGNRPQKFLRRRAGRPNSIAPKAPRKILL